MTELFTDIRVRFGEINRDDQLTPEDKKRITEFFLQNMIAPKAHKLLEEHFPEDFRIVGSENSEPLIPEILSRSALAGEVSSKFR